MKHSKEDNRWCVGPEIACKRMEEICEKCIDRECDLFTSQMDSCLKLEEACEENEDHKECEFYRKENVQLWKCVANTNRVSTEPPGLIINGVNNVRRYLDVFGDSASIEEYIVAHNFVGLYNPDGEEACCCKHDDLGPCGAIGYECLFDDGSHKCYE